MLYDPKFIIDKYVLSVYNECIIESEGLFMRINITMDDDLIKKVDEVAKKMYVSRSAYIAFAVSQKMQQDSLMENMPEMLQTMKSAIEVEKLKSKND